MRGSKKLQVFSPAKDRLITQKTVFSWIEESARRSEISYIILLKSIHYITVFIVFYGFR